MELPAKESLAILKEKGVTHLHHANSVVTACSFIRFNALLSRGEMERRGLPQSSQLSDATDRSLGVYHDIFLDTVDIHNRASKRNIYGTVLFRIGLDSILEHDFPPIWITRSNPMGWKSSTKHADRWFQSTADLKKDFVKGRFDQMIVFRHVGGFLSLTKLLEDVMVDDPQLKVGDFSYFDLSVGALQLARSYSKAFKAKIVRRECGAKCKCRTEYASNTNATKDMFIPRVK